MGGDLPAIARAGMECNESLATAPPAGPEPAGGAWQRGGNHDGDLAEQLAKALATCHSRCSLSVPEIARLLGIHHRTLQRRLQREAGCSPTEFLNRYRLSRARRLLELGQPVTEVALEVGYKNAAHFSTKFKSVFGTAPSRFRATALDQ